LDHCRPSTAFRTRPTSFVHPSLIRNGGRGKIETQEGVPEDSHALWRANGPRGSWPPYRVGPHEAMEGIPAAVEDGKAGVTLLVGGARDARLRGRRLCPFGPSRSGIGWGGANLGKKPVLFSRPKNGPETVSQLFGAKSEPAWEASVTGKPLEKSGVGKMIWGNIAGAKRGPLASRCGYLPHRKKGWLPRRLFYPGANYRLPDKEFPSGKRWFFSFPGLHKIELIPPRTPAK